MKPTFVLPVLLLLSWPVVTAAQDNEQASAVNPARLWLPPSREHLMPMLAYAAELALSDPDCNQVLYGRLNEYRTENGDEPTMTILCQQDARTTFNLVYQASDLEAAMPAANTEFSEDDADSNLDALRNLLMSNSELRDQQRGEADTSGEEETTESRDNLDLELELEEMLRNRERPSENPPELF